MATVTMCLVLSLAACIESGAEPSQKTQLIIQGDGGLKMPQPSEERVVEEKERTPLGGTALNGEGTLASLAEAESPQAQRQLVRRHQGSEANVLEENQRQQPPTIFDGEGGMKDPAVPPTTPLFAVSFDEMGKLMYSLPSPASLLDTAQAVTKAMLSSPSAGTGPCAELHTWGYDTVQQCRDESAPFKPSACFCELQQRTYRTRYCNANATAGDDDDDGGSALYGYGQCDTCCVRNHTVSAAVACCLFVLLLCCCICFGGFAKIVGTMSAKNKEYDAMRQQLAEAEAAAAAAGTEAAPPAEGAASTPPPAK